VPEITVRICEFDRDPPSAALFQIDRHYTAFASFFGEAIDDEDLLAEFYVGLHVEQAAVLAHSHRGGYIAEGTVPGGPTVNFDWNRKRESLATPAFDHWDLPGNVRNWPLI